MDPIRNSLTVPPADPSLTESEPAAARLFDVADWRRRVFGDEYADATLATYEAKDPKQQAAAKAVALYCRDIRERFSDAENLVLIGPVGTGKDHLAVCVACAAAEAGFTVAHLVGASWFEECRERMFDHQYPIARKFRLADFLVMSDPQPVRGVVSDAQARWLYELLDERYRLKRPTIATLNAESATDAAGRCGEASIDRLRHRAMVVWCQWPSYRKAGRVVNKPEAAR